MIDEIIVTNYLRKRIREEVNTLEKISSGQTKLEPGECCQITKINCQITKIKELKIIHKDLVGDF